MKNKVLSILIAIAFLFSSVLPAGEVFAVDEPTDGQGQGTEIVLDEGTPGEQSDPQGTGDEQVVTQEPVVTESPGETTESTAPIEPAGSGESEQPEEPALPIVSEEALVNAPVILSYEQDENGDHVLTFSADLRISGFELQYGTSKIFMGTEIKSAELPAKAGSYEVNGTVASEISEASQTDETVVCDEQGEPIVEEPVEIPDFTVILSALDESKVYYARVRSYIEDEEGLRQYSPWATTDNIRETSKGASGRLTYGATGTTIFDLYPRAGQKLGEYDIMEGGCNDGTYFYYVLYNRSIENCKVVKVRMSDRKVMQVSGPTGAAHGNGITYNEATNELVLTHTKVVPNRLTIMDAGTLTVKRRVNVTFPETLEGDKGGRLAKITGLLDIHYLPETDQYATLTKGSTEVMILDADFEPVCMIPLSKKKTADYLYQGFDITDDYILIAESGHPNIIVIYDRSGKYLSAVTLMKSWEIENITHYGDKYYAGVYANNTYTTTEKYKKYKYKTKIKKVWKKKKVYNKRTKRYYTKWYRAKVKKKVKTKKYTWATRKVTHVVRNNYIYRIKF